MTVDVDAVNERLNGLVNLLNVVGLDGVDPDALVKEQKRLSDAKNSDSAPSSARAQPSSDDQILEIIKKLQQAQADSPEILAALKSPELRALASLAAQKNVAKPPEPEKKAPPSLDDVMDDDDNYPKIGPGYSDDISVVSDLTTPTVMTKQHVQEEEYYRDVNGGPGALPPMNIALGGPSQPSRPPMSVGGAHMNPPKTRNLVSQVKPAASRRAIAKTGGAAAQRRLNYQQAMAKLQSTEYSSPAAGAKQDKSYMDSFSPKKKPAFFPASPTPTHDPSEFPSMTDTSGKKSSKPKKLANTKGGRSKDKNKSLASQEEQEISFGDTEPSTGSSSSPSKKKTSKEKDLDWGTNDGGWPAFDSKPDSKKKKGGKDVFVDNDGFFAGDAFAGGDPFASTSKSSSKKSSKDPFSDSKESRSRKKHSGDGSSDKPKKDRDKSKSGKSKSRRASLQV